MGLPFILKNKQNNDSLQDILQNLYKENFVNELLPNVDKNKNEDDKNKNEDDSVKASTKDVTKNVLNSIKNKSITGIRIEAAGRLTRRYTAAKSIFKVRYKGNLKNMNSSIKGLPTVMLIGHNKSNIQYTNLNSHVRIGSFGIKG